MTFPDGSPPGATVLAQVTISNDSNVENDEIFSIQGSSADPDVVFAADRDVANVTILDDDGETAFYDNIHVYSWKELAGK